MAKFRIQKFFSKEILPKSIADKGEKSISEFEDGEMGRAIFRFKEGDEVVHKYNLEQNMIVQEVRQKRSIVRGDERIRLDGIVCHWWDTNDTTES